MFPCYRRFIEVEFVNINMSKLGRSAQKSQSAPYREAGKGSQSLTHSVI